MSFHIHGHTVSLDGNDITDQVESITIEYRNGDTTTRHPPVTRLAAILQALTTLAAPTDGIAPSDPVRYPDNTTDKGT